MPPKPKGRSRQRSSANKCATAGSSRRPQRPRTPARPTPSTPAEVLPEPQPCETAGPPMFSPADASIPSHESIIGGIYQRMCRDGLLGVATSREAPSTDSGTRITQPVPPAVASVAHASPAAPSSSHQPLQEGPVQSESTLGRSVPAALLVALVGPQPMGHFSHSHFFHGCFHVLDNTCISFCHSCVLFFYYTVDTLICLMGHRRSATRSHICPRAKT